MFLVDDEELIYFRSHVFNPLPVTTPVMIIVPNAPVIPQWVEFYPDPVYTHPLFGVL